MENLNVEEIKCGLEHCTAKSYKCEECPYFYKSEGLKSSMEILMTDALALITSQEQRIKELTEENERLKTIPEQLYKEMSEQMLEECKIARKLTVRKMQTEIKKTFSAICKGEMVDLYRIIDQIAKEMLEGENETGI